MYFWNIRKLKEDINNGKLNDKMTLPYIIIYTGIASVMIELGFYIDLYEKTIVEYLFSFISIFILTAGIFYLYKQNNGELGNNFANKYFSLGFVFFIRFMSFIIPIFLVLIIYDSEIAENSYFSEYYISDIINIFTMILYYYFLGKHIKDVSYNKK